MHTHTIPLLSVAPGSQSSLQVLRFGTSGARPKVYIQAALHADEIPALLVAQALKLQLQTLETQGLIQGEVVLVPYANPIGLAQHVMTQHHGRFDLRDGVNFNRGYADLVEPVAQHVAGQLGSDTAVNTALIRAALCDAALRLKANSPAEDLKNRLLQLAIDADIVLDLHCDNEAVMHVYALSPQADIAGELAAFLGARALLLAPESGDSPFDEACSRPWLALQHRFAGHPIALACFSTTIELRGECDVQHEYAAQDATAIVNFLRWRGVLGGGAVLPHAQCEATPLAGSEPITAPAAGVIVFRREVGEQVAAGDVIVDLVNVQTGEITPLRCGSSGVLYARCASRWAYPGKRLAKVAGAAITRTGKLLSP